MLRKFPFTARSVVTHPYYSATLCLRELLYSLICKLLSPACLSRDFCGAYCGWAWFLPRCAGLGGCVVVWTDSRGMHHFRPGAAAGSRCSTGFCCYCGRRGLRRTSPRISSEIAGIPCPVLYPFSWRIWSPLRLVLCVDSALTDETLPFILFVLLFKMYCNTKISAHIYLIYRFI